VSANTVLNIYMISTNYRTTWAIILSHACIHLTNTRQSLSFYELLFFSFLSLTSAKNIWPDNATVCSVVLSGKCTELFSSNEISLVSVIKPWKWKLNHHSRGDCYKIIADILPILLSWIMIFIIQFTSHWEWTVLTSREEEVLVSVAPLRTGHGQGRGDGCGEALQRHFDVDLSTQKNFCMQNNKTFETKSRPHLDMHLVDLT